MRCRARFSFFFFFSPHALSPLLAAGYLHTTPFRLLIEARCYAFRPQAVAVADYAVGYATYAYYELPPFLLCRIATFLQHKCTNMFRITRHMPPPFSCRYFCDCSGHCLYRLSHAMLFFFFSLVTAMRACYAWTCDAYAYASPPCCAPLPYAARAIDKMPPC